MFNVCIKHMSKVLDCYKTYEFDEDHKFVTFVNKSNLIKCMFNV